MPEDPAPNVRSRDGKFSEEIGAQELRKLHARRADAGGIWSGFGLFGLIGWSVAIPTLLGALLGAWLDRRRPGAHSWTLALLVGGLCIGCMNAWHWVAKEGRAISAKRESED